MSFRRRLLAAAALVASAFGAYAQCPDNFTPATVTEITITQGANPRQFIVCLGLNATVDLGGGDVRAVNCISAFYAISDFGELHAIGAVQNNWEYNECLEQAAGWKTESITLAIGPGSCFVFEFGALNRDAVNRFGLRLTTPGGVELISVPEPISLAGLIVASGGVSLVLRRRRA